MKGINTISVNEVNKMNTTTKINSNLFVISP